MADPLESFAYSKLNFVLTVNDRGADGYHPIKSVVQSISWADGLSLRDADSDSFEAEGMAADDENLAWRAVDAVRRAVGVSRPVSLILDKQVPIAAGMGGGSADAAAGLVMAAELFGLSETELPSLAEDLGSDVPFCLRGGLAMIEGRGEIVSPLGAPGEDYAVLVVVPPIELPTASVYDEWDRLGGPQGEAARPSGLPPSMRRFEPLRNDLEPAAYSLAPLVADWRDELASIWSRPVLMTGSGPALYGFFLDADEANDGLEAVPAGSRARQVAVPVARGWEMSGGTLAGPN